MLARWRAVASRPRRPQLARQAPAVAEIAALRRQRLTSPQIAHRLRLPLSTLGAILRRLRLSRFSPWRTA
jgi:hypothetical protein